MKRVPKLFQLARAWRAPASEQVHFHRGPQGQPSPCYDGGCAIPQLSLDEQ